MIVKSRPMIHASYLGETLVPFCRTMMFPVVNCAHHRYFLTPRILGLESRPLLVLPPDFLCAMDLSPNF
jgi:hypothetical protein